MDIAAAQFALGRGGLVDRILIRLPSKTSVPLNDWRQRAQQVLPESVQLRPTGASTDENRKMLDAFRWNLRLLSYIALIVGAFLIYNTISVSVVRRRAEIGIVRALGASRRQVLIAFLLEAALIGMTGSLLGIPIGRLLASSAVKLMGATVNSLYVSSRPGEISFDLSSILLALLTGFGVTLVSAWAPGREAAMVAPVEAIARGRREFEIRVNKKLALSVAGIFAVTAASISRLPPVSGKPIFGYCAALLAVAAGVFAIPVLTDLAMRISARVLPRLLDVEALLASRSLAGSLRRTSVLVAALSTAIAMTVAVGIMVGSFRQTVILWMKSELPADLTFARREIPLPTSIRSSLRNLPIKSPNCLAFARFSACALTKSATTACPRLWLALIWPTRKSSTPLIFFRVEALPKSCPNCAAPTPSSLVSRSVISTAFAAVTPFSSL